MRWFPYYVHFPGSFRVYHTGIIPETRISEVYGFWISKMSLVWGLYHYHLPIQNLEKIFSSKSSVVTLPVISPR